MLDIPMLGYEDYIAIIRNLNETIALKDQKIEEMDEAGCDALERLEDMTYAQQLIDSTIESYQAEIKELKKKLAKATKGAKAPKAIKELKVIKKVGRPKKVAAAPAKRKPGRPKKAVK